MEQSMQNTSSGGVDELLFKLELKGDGISVNKEISQDMARQVLDIILGGSAKSPTLSPRREGVVQHAGNPTISPYSRPFDDRISLREYLDAVNAKRNPDKITAIAGYLKEQENIESFTREDIKVRFRTAGEAPPGNYSRDFNWAVSNGWLAPENGIPDHYWLTSTGEKAIGEQFANGVRKASAIKAGRKKKGKSGQLNGDTNEQ
jgi:hypothetical protein